MGVSDIIGKVVGTVAGPVVDYLKTRALIKAEDRKQERELKAAIHTRQIELISQGLAADATWEIEQIKNSGWKDEFVLVVLSIPMVGCFIPYVNVFVQRGFEILEGTPVWYRSLGIMIFAATYGIRVWRRQKDA